MDTSETPEQLRDKHRMLRASLPAHTQTAHAESMCQRLLSIAELQQAHHVAAYIAIRGEISLEGLLPQLQQAGKQLYLPVLRGETMHFSPWSTTEPLLKKGFGLLEPDSPESSWISPEALDVVLAPLVVFDPHCNRIGQGGGYYDRTFAFRQNNDSQKPMLLGVAHDEQRESQLSPQHWDIPLDLIVTDKALYSR